MRTTLTIEEDVASALRRLQAERKTSLKQLVNEVLRAGLTVLGGPRRRRKPYRMKPVSLGRCKLPSLDDITGVLSVVEGDDHK